MKNEDEKQNKDILKGKYKDYYLVYNRRSTDDVDNQKNSLTYQRRENLAFAKKQDLKIAHLSIKNFCKDGIISEKHSGFKESDELTITDDGQVKYRVARPKFHQLTHFLNQKYFKGVIALSFDRISRNKSDNAIIDKLRRNGVDVRFAYASYDNTSSGALHMDIDGMFAIHHSRVTSEKVTLATRNLRERGICTYKAPVGYLNEGDATSKPLDEKRAPIIREMFEKYESGEWTLSALARWANDIGFTMPAVRRRRTEDEIMGEDTDTATDIEAVERPVTYGQVQKILTNRFYTGYIIGVDGIGWILSNSHEPIVTIELFEKVQVKLNGKNVSQHYQSFLNHPYRKFVRCRECKRVYTPYPKKGTLYFGSKCQSCCPNKVPSFNVNLLEERIAKIISQLHFTKNEIAEFEARLKTDVAVLEGRRTKEIEQMDRKKRKVREDLKYLRENKLTLLRFGTYTAQDYIKEEKSLHEQLTELQIEESISDEAMHETIKEIVQLSELLENIVPYYEFANTEEREKIARIIFSELYMDENTLHFKLTTGMKPFEYRLYAICDPTENRTPISRMRT